MDLLDAGVEVAVFLVGVRLSGLDVFDGEHDGFATLIVEAVTEVQLVDVSNAGS